MMMRYRERYYTMREGEEMQNCSETYRDTKLFRGKNFGGEKHQVCHT